MSEPIEHYEFVDPKSSSYRLPYQTQNNIDYLKIKIFKFKPQIDSNIVVLTVCSLLKPLSAYSSSFWVMSLLLD